MLLANRRTVCRQQDGLQARWLDLAPDQTVLSGGAGLQFLRIPGSDLCLPRDFPTETLLPNLTLATAQSRAQSWRSILQGTERQCWLTQ